MISAYELNKTGNEIEKDHRGGHGENGPEMGVELTFVRGKCQHPDTRGGAFWEEETARGQVSEEGMSLVRLRTEVLCGWCAGLEGALERSAGQLGRV